MGIRTGITYAPPKEMANAFDMGRVMQRFWSPFSRHIRGPNLHAYGFGEMFNDIRTPDSDFTCQVNGRVGGAKLVEDFFIVLLCGFDFERVKIERQMAPGGTTDPCQFSGTYVLAHTRPFLGWKPRLIERSVDRCTPSPSCSSGATAENREVCLERPPSAKESFPSLVINVPFTARLEGNVGRISHLVFRSPVIDVITVHESCPETVRSCLQNPEALQALVTLRRANVRPSIITDKTLMGITAKKEAWSSALGIL
uniref:Uncharacterized protein n=1 Tax=Trypanosoma congolense (strain IL3000) TaxID=1068625 RepID=G0UUF2_TRYCI|nr:conserved hypothetical protein [Trypanosoma congolense IL3000]